jgi:hypothetical protein
MRTGDFLDDEFSLLAVLWRNVVPYVVTSISDELAACNFRIDENRSRWLLSDFTAYQTTRCHIRQS